MKVQYFPDTDTAYIEFSQNKVWETRDINENTLIDLDKDGNLVGMTIEHATNTANIAEISYHQMKGNKSNTSLQSTQRKF